MVKKGRIPNRLKKYRCIKGYTQTHVAKILGMKQSNLISEWEKGITAPSLDNLLKLSCIYQTLIEEIYFERWQIHRNNFVPSNEKVRIINLREEVKINKPKRKRTR